MGDFFVASEARRAVNGLNWLFDDDLSNTFQKVEKLRKVYPNLLNPTSTTDPWEVRKQTLRFAAFHVTDKVPFNTGGYPAKKFRKWLKYLTWLGQETGGTRKLNGNDYQGTAAALILEALQAALPPGGSPKKVLFKFDPGALKVIVTTTSSPIRIEVSSKREQDGIPDNGDDEDDV